MTDGENTLNFDASIDIFCHFEVLSLLKFSRC